MSQEPALEAFCAFFNKLDTTYTNKLYEVYTEDVVFTDPLHHIQGRDALERYFRGLYENVTECSFEFHDRLHQGHEACVTWTMRLIHPRLARGRPVSVDGCSRLSFPAEDPRRVCRHRDFFDAGAMLYEHLPILGPTVRLLKRRLGE
ncbi:MULTISPECIES: nuclear transport factor 2 family protein [Halomonas]|uniref:SnoaL-like domain protein n=1 Tax=Halomonas chromatireducens TaxID=507626 RepID=A0A109UKP1_9GAMM|nr:MULTISPECIES: nuclear transport factor 2 family protein [Halomonas]AMC99253.1 SnoaL-like domain protein [Halomonas chromatireducens]MBZ0332129.1 nuclear transport factor 2 family protein [Halomonas sp. ANAO-440]